MQPLGLNFRQFWRIGREQWLAQDSMPARAFVRLLGPLGMHARIRNAHLLRVLSGLELPSNARVLDAGCGHAYATFWLAQRFPSHHLVGIEQDAALVAANKRIATELGLAGVEFRHGSVETVGEDAAYDLVFSIDVLEHVVDDVGVLRCFRRALKPGGVLLLHLPLRHQAQRRVFPVFRQHVVDDHVRDEYTPDEIGAKLREAGFRLRWQGWGFGLAGELAFELNYLGWRRSWLRNLLALLTFPLALPLAYLDVRTAPEQGNSLLLLAEPVEG
jgi:SAM-dependent methyltransferase